MPDSAVTCSPREDRERHDMRVLTSAMIAAAGLGTAAAVALVADGGPDRQEAATVRVVLPTTTAAPVHPTGGIATATPKPAGPGAAQKPHHPKRAPKPEHRPGRDKDKAKVKDKPKGKSTSHGAERER